jgi:ComF family protein
MKYFLTEVCKDFISMVYPRYCITCHDGLAKGEEWLCTKCLIQLPKSNYHLNKSNPLFNRLSGRFPLDFASPFLLFRKQGKAQQILHVLKYHNRPELGVILGAAFGEDLCQSHCVPDIDVIVPIPLHPQRQQKRGYNQSEEFARGLSLKLNIPVETNAVKRIVKTDTQTNKNKLLRWRNVKEVFEVTDCSLLANKHILLVDDVVTTGATIEACAHKLIKGGSRMISVASIAYAANRP